MLFRSLYAPVWAGATGSAGTGERTLTYPTETYSAWASAETLSDREAFYAAATVENAAYRFVVRYHSALDNLTTEYRIKWGSDWYDVGSLKYDLATVEILATEVPPNAQS